jgi:hypothetical protein
MNTLARPAKVMVNALHRVCRDLSNHIVQDVPEAIALCEFDCHKAECTAKEWASCARRLNKAAAELTCVRSYRNSLSPNLDEN